MSVEAGDIGCGGNSSLTRYGAIVCDRTLDDLLDISRDARQI